MAVWIPDSRFGRALKAGIPIALALFAVELFEGSLRIDRDGHAFSLSWSPAAAGREVPNGPAIKLVSCADGSCRNIALSISLRTPQIASDMAAFAGSLADVVWSDCPERRGERLAHA